MTVVLNEQTRELLESQVELGLYATADEAANSILQEYLAPGLDLGPLKDSLRVAMKQPRIPYRSGMFAELGEEVIARARAK